MELSRMELPGMERLRCHILVDTRLARRLRFLVVGVPVFGKVFVRVCLSGLGF
jgi:hypothetical protein